MSNLGLYINLTSSVQTTSIVPIGDAGMGLMWIAIMLETFYDVNNLGETKC